MLNNRIDKYLVKIDSYDISAVPEKPGHVVHGAILFPRLLMRTYTVYSWQNDGISCL